MYGSTDAWSGRAMGGQEREVASLLPVKREAQVTGKMQGKTRFLLRTERRAFARAHKKKKSDDKKWDRNLRKLSAYRNAEGHSNVPQSYRVGGLGRWVNNQRTAYQKGKLSQERIEKLQGNGFVWFVGRGGKSSGAGRR